jgi:hypothetical protein
MPSAPRERKPALALLAALLVIVGAVAAGLLVLKAGHKVSAIEVVQPLGPGEQIPAQALREVQISSDSGIAYISWSEVGAVEQVFAASAIPAGTLLTPEMTAKSSNVTSNDAQVGVSLKAGQVPANLQIGDKVQAFAVGPPTPCGGTADESLGSGTVTGVNGAASNSSATTVVTLAVPTGGATYGLLACEASNNTVAIVIMPASGNG